MTKLCILSDILSNDTIVTSSFKDDCLVKYYDYNNSASAFQDVDYSTITHLAFFYHFPGYYSIPFLDENYEETYDDSGNAIPPEKEPYNYNYFGDQLIDKVKEIRDATSVTLIIDLVCCNLNYIDFKNEVERFESEFNVNIRYSIDNTGNNPDGNWVLESDDVNIKDLYFTSGIDAWTGILTSAIDIDDNFFNDGINFSRDYTTSTVTLLQDITWQTIRVANSGLVTDYINMKPGWTFDGSENIITINSSSSTVTDFRGLFSIDSNVTNFNDAPIIKDVSFNVDTSNGSVELSLRTAGGSFCMRTSQKFFILDNCHTTSNCVINGGYSSGFTARRAGYQGHAIIRNCVNRGDITHGEAGGIVGAQAGYQGIIEIYNCVNYGDTMGGGIAGNTFGVDSIEINVDNCKNYGEINTSNNAGGIISLVYALYGNIKNCENYGNITKGSGIINKLHYTNSSINIFNCVNYGDMIGISSVTGIIKDLKNNTITNCVNYGDMIGTTNVTGIAGSNYGKIVNCINHGDISGDNCAAICSGSYSPVVGNELLISNCINYGNIKGTRNSALAKNISFSTSTLTDEFSFSSKIINCINYGNIDIDFIQTDPPTDNDNSIFVYNAGCTGLSYRRENVFLYMSNCVNYGDVSGYNNGFIGGDVNNINISIDNCIFSGRFDCQPASAYFFNFKSAYLNSSENFVIYIKIANTYVINCSEYSINNPFVILNNDNTNILNNITKKVLISNCYKIVEKPDEDVGFIYAYPDDKAQWVINSCYTNNYFIGKTDGQGNPTLKDKLNRIAIVNCYYNPGMFNNANTQSVVFAHDRVLGGIGAYNNMIQGTFDINDISGSSIQFDDNSLNNILSLSDIQSFSPPNTIGIPTDYWSYGAWNGVNDIQELFITPPQESDLFVYYGGILLKKFLSYPWSGYTSFDSSAQLVDVSSIQLTSSYNIDDIFTFTSGNLITTTVGNNEIAISEWFTGANYVSVSGGYATITEEDIPIIGTKKFVTNYNDVVFQTDNGDISFNNIESLGQSFTVTMSGEDYPVKFVMAGSTGFEVGTGPYIGSGGDPHVFPLYKKIPIFNLPCKHGSYFQYLVYKNNHETVIMNVMTWMMLLDDSKMKSSNRLLKKFISRPKYYLCYLYISYSNDNTDDKEDICIDLRKMKCVNTSLRNYTTLANKCKLPIIKTPSKELNNIKLSSKYMPRKRILRYRAIKKTHGNITIYTKDSKFELLFGNATENLAFGTYMEIYKYPQDLLKNGKGILVNPTGYKHIYDLKSDDKQTSKNKLLKI